MRPRNLYDPILVHTPQKGYFARVRIDGKEFQSEATDLVAGMNLVPIKTEKLAGYVVLGGPTMRPYHKNNPGGK
jgi:hypothetical protein